jgi:hypothetical protein
MTRARVPSDHAERVIGGVRETYDRDEYLDEKRIAPAKLSALLRESLAQPRGCCRNPWSTHLDCGGLGIHLNVIGPRAYEVSLEN